MHIFSILNDRSVVLDLDAASKEEAIGKLVDRLKGSPKVLDPLRIRQAVLEREGMATTGVGDGFSIPHARTDAVTDLIAAFAVTREPLDFHSLDDQPVRLILLLVGPEMRVGSYIKLLSRLRSIMSSASFRKKLLQATGSADVIAAFREEEERYFEMA